MALGVTILTVAGTLSLFVLIFALGIVSLQCCFHACYLRRAQLASSQSQTQSAPWRPRDWGRGTTTPVLPRSLPPTAVYRSMNKEEEEEEAAECVVCLAELQDGEVARFLPCCNHGFHARCVDAWLAARSTCPLCRIAVVVDMPPVPALALRPLPPEPANYAPPTCPRRACLLGCPTSWAR